MKTIGNILKVLFSFPTLIATGILYIVFLCFYVYYDEPEQLDWIGNTLLIIVLAIALKLFVEWIVGPFKDKDE